MEKKIKVQLSYQVRGTVTKEIELTTEQYEGLVNHKNTLFEIEDSICRKDPNYVDESIFLDDFGY